MTTVASKSFGGMGGFGQGASSHGKSAWRRVWQIPLLLLGVVVFGLGVKQLVHAIRPVPFDEQVDGIRKTLKAGKEAKAIEQINTLADYYYRDRDKLAQLQWLAGDAHYLAQKKSAGFVRANYERAEEHYRKAVVLGAQPTPLMNERWGEAALALGDAKLAIEKLEAAAGADSEKLLAHAKELVSAYIVVGDYVKAQNVVDRVLAQKGLEVDDRAWGLCKKIELAMASQGVKNAGGVAGGELDRAIATATAVLKDMPELDPGGRVLLWIGRAEFERGQVEAAKGNLEAARGRFIVHHMDDGRAAVLLGRIATMRGELETAGNLFQEVVTRHAGTTLWAAARLGRAEVLALQGDAGEQMEMDYRFAIKAVTDTGPASIGEGKGPAEMVSIEQVRNSLLAENQKYAAADKLDGALKFLALNAELKERETPAIAYRAATTKERRAGEMLVEVTTMPAGAAGGAAEKARESKKAQAKALLAQAAEDYRRHAKLMTMEDAVSGNSLWKAAQLFDEAGETMQSIQVYEQFTVQRPRDSRTPEGLLAIGRLYQSVGQVEKAIHFYKRNIEENPKTPAAYTSALNLARCFMMRGPEEFDNAEKTLLKLVQDNEDLLPTANEYRLSLFTLGELYYRNGKWRDAIGRLEESIERYPDDKGVTRALFMLGESYRKSAMEINDALKKDSRIEHREALAKAQAERFKRGAELLSRVIGNLDVDPDQVDAGTRPQLGALEEEYLRTSYMDRADCYFSLGDYATAIKLYDVTATRFSQDVTAIEAYVQIVNAYRAMGQPLQASAAAERARWVLKRIPEEAFGRGPVALSRQYYEELLKLSKESS